MSLLRPDGSEAISPTAHYMGFVWARNGLSPPGVATLAGRVLFESLRAPMATAFFSAEARSRPTCSRATADRRTVAARNRGARRRAGDRDRRGHVRSRREVRAEIRRSPALRGGRPPSDGRAQRRTLARLNALSERHRVEGLDALRDSGSRSLPEPARPLDQNLGLAIITEGLSAISSSRRRKPGGDASRRFFRRSERGPTSPTSISARTRTYGSRPSAWCWRLSCAGLCTSISAKSPRWWAP